MIVITEATVQYACRLSAKDEQMVRDYAKENDTTFEEAVDALYSGCAIDLYADSWESDFSTDKILEVEE